MLRRLLFPAATAAALASLGALGALGARLAIAGELRPTGIDASASHGPTVVATIGRERITAADVAAEDRAAFEKLEADYALKLRQLALKQAQARHELLQQRLDVLLDRRALQMEAKARATTTQAVLAELKVPEVTDAEAHAFYELNKARTRDAFEKLQPDIVRHLASQHREDASRAFYDQLRARHGIASLVGPYRVTVAATGPSRGSDDAPITIVEFADFQCPYCREAEESLRLVMSKYSGEVRLVFRNLPLPSVHPNAVTAAEAGVCANRQGRFWEMHDAMYQNQSALSEGALADTAKRLGLKPEGFAACLADPQTKDALNDDARAADELNINSTPAFFINGRPLYGSVPVERFESLISDELRRASKRDEPKRG